jgi:hypothetical protein
MAGNSRKKVIPVLVSLGVVLSECLKKNKIKKELVKEMAD